MRILFLSRWFPVPPDNGSKLRVLHLLEALASRHEIAFASFVSEPPSQAETERLLRICSRVDTLPLPTFEPHRSGSMSGLLASLPRSVSATFSSEMHALVRRLQADLRPEIVIASQIDMAPYALGLSGVPRILEELELTTFYDQYASARNLGIRVRRGLMWMKRAAYTRRIVAAFDAYTVVSTVERELARRVCPQASPPAVIPNGVETRGLGVDVRPVPGTIVYAGSVTYPPNLDAVRYFASRILPLVRVKSPEATFLVTGKTDGVDLAELKRMVGVQFTGALEDVRPTIASSWLSVAPIRLGGGTRLKILESLSLGTPVVSSSKGAQGLGLVPGQHLLIGDTQKAFAAAVGQLLGDAEMRDRIGQEGRREVRARYAWDQIEAGFLALVETTVARVGG
jgi:glycosyltransferase involved in cell wall biosynthesis